MRTVRTRFAIAAALAIFMVIPVSAGERDTHLALTYYLARRAGFNDQDAALIASANWSMLTVVAPCPIAALRPEPSW